jgi:hypothetical protein
LHEDVADSEGNENDGGFAASFERFKSGVETVPGKKVENEEIAGGEIEGNEAFDERGKTSGSGNGRLGKRRNDLGLWLCG